MRNNPSLDQMGSDQADQLYDDTVIDSNGNHVGSVDGVWVDDATRRAEFIAVKTGWLFGTNHLLPIEQAQIDPTTQTIQVPYAQDQIKNGPSFPSDHDLTPDDEQQIYDYYGLQRSTQPSPTGYAGGTEGVTGQQNLATGQGEIEVPLVAEELQVGKRPVEQQQAGEVRLRKVVRTEREEVPVELTHEEVEIERVPASQVSAAQVPATAFQEQEIDVQAREEEPVISKQAQVTGGYRVTKTPVTETRTVGADVRREEVEVEESGDVDVDVESPQNQP